MKSEERHQLRQNDLQVATTKTVGFAERHFGTVIAIVAVVAVVAVIGLVWSQTTDTSSGEGWTMLSTAASEEDLNGVVDKYKGKPPGQWAQLQIAEKTLQQAMPLMFTSREIALTDLKRAREGFESLLQDKSVSATLRERSLWGFALCLETGCDGDTAKPVDAYKRLLTEFPNSTFKAVADDRLAALNRQDASEFFAWFSKEDPKPPEIRPRDGAARTTPPGPDEDPFEKDPHGMVPLKGDLPLLQDDQKQDDQKEDKQPGDSPAPEKKEGETKPAEGETPKTEDAPKDGDKPTVKE